MSRLARVVSSPLRVVASLMLVMLFLYGSSLYYGSGQANYDEAGAVGPALTQAYQELIELSQREKKGLTFFVKGEKIAGIVVRTIGAEAVEVRSQIYSRVINRLESVDAVALN